MQQSTHSLSDGSYDMIDDISDLSSDDHDTVSLASIDQNDDQDHNDDDDDGNPYNQIAAVLDDLRSLPVGDDHFYQDDPQPPYDQLLDEPTPQQSVVTVQHVPDGKPSDDPETGPAKQLSNLRLSTILGNPLLQAICSVLFVIVVYQTIVLSLIYPTLLSKDLKAENRARQIHLAQSIAEICPSQTFNVSHLLPLPVVTGTSLLGSNLYRASEVRYQVVGSIRLIVALPKVYDHTFPQPTSVKVTRDDLKLNATVTQLIDGVHAIALPPKDAFGLVTLNILCQSPKLAVTITHDFGQPIIHAVRSLAERVIATDIPAFVGQAALVIDQAATSAQKLEQQMKHFTGLAREEMVRDLHLARERALSIVSGLKDFAFKEYEIEVTCEGEF